MTRDEWIDVGLAQGWIEARCLMHDWIGDLMSESDLGQFDEGDDPCVHRFVTTDVDVRTDVR